jgi:hypothetical protein
MTPTEIVNTSRLADGLTWDDLEATVKHGAPLPRQTAKDKEDILRHKLAGAQMGTHSGLGEPVSSKIDREGYDWSKTGISVAHSIDRVTVPPVVVDGHHRLAHMLHVAPDTFVPVSHPRPIFGI